MPNTDVTIDPKGGCRSANIDAVVLSRPIENPGDLFTGSGRVVSCCLLNLINISTLSSRITQRALLRTLLDSDVIGKVLNWFIKKCVTVWSL
jgi:hypothetical protein